MDSSLRHMCFKLEVCFYKPHLSNTRRLDLVVSSRMDSGEVRTVSNVVYVEYRVPHIHTHTLRRYAQVSEELNPLSHVDL